MHEAGAKAMAGHWTTLVIDAHTALAAHPQTRSLRFLGLRAVQVCATVLLVIV